MEKDAEEACGARHARSEERRGHRWGRTEGKLGFHPGKVTVERPRARDLAGRELVLPSWDRAVAEDWLGKWAMNLQRLPVDLNQDGFHRVGRGFVALIRLQEDDDAEGLFGGFAGTGDRDGAGWRFAARGGRFSVAGSTAVKWLQRWEKGCDSK
jgi:hypothetical protein